MRNSTKLKLVLSMYDAQLTLDDDARFKLILTHRKNGYRAMFEEKNYTHLMNHAFSYMKKQLTDEELIIKSDLPD